MLRLSPRAILATTAVAGLAALIVIVCATAALAGVWLPGQQSSEPSIQRVQAAPTFHRATTGTVTVQKAPVVAPAPPAPSGDVWGRLAQCESGGNPANKRNPSYRGMYQFSWGTWRAMGGTGDPADAPHSEQLMRAKKLQAQSGWGQWPACSRKLGLR